MRVAVCELEAGLLPGTSQWSSLIQSVARAAPTMLLLNEMPFGQWVAASPEPSQSAITASCSDHDQGIAQLPSLRVPIVLGTRPAHEGERLVNEAFAWTQERGYIPVHTKQYFPDEPEYYEARWFKGGARRFESWQGPGIRIGFMICTEVMFNEHARRYGRNGCDVIAVPRDVGPTTLRRWLVAMRMAAIVSGCYVISSNRSGTDSNEQTFGGHGWIIDPQGDVVAETSEASPVVYHDLDLSLVARAQREYPNYVRELAP